MEQVWKQEIQGTNIFKLWSKLILCRTPLKQLKQANKGSVDTKVDLAREKLQGIQDLITATSSPDLLRLEKKVINDMNNW